VIGNVRILRDALGGRGV